MCDGDRCRAPGTRQCLVTSILRAVASGRLTRTLRLALIPSHLSRVAWVFFGVWSPLLPLVGFWFPCPRGARSPWLGRALVWLVVAWLLSGAVGLLSGSWFLGCSVPCGILRRVEMNASSPGPIVLIGGRLSHCKYMLIFSGFYLQWLLNTCMFSGNFDAPSFGLYRLQLFSG